MSDGMTDMLRESRRLDKYPYSVKCKRCGEGLLSDTKEDVDPERCPHCVSKMLNLI